MQVRLQLRRDLGCEQTDLDVNSTSAQRGQTLPSHSGIRVCYSNDHPRHAGGENRVDARRSPTVMGTWFQRDDQRRAYSSIAGSAQRDDFGVVPAWRLRGADANDFALG
jgi:hypothetical protein